MKRVGIAVAGIVVALLIIVVILPFFISANTFLPELEQRLSATLGRKTTISSLSLNLLAGGLKANNLVVADDPAFSTQPFLQAKELRVGVNMGSLLFHKQLDVKRLDVIDPDIQLLQNSAGHWNYSTLGAQSKKTSAQNNPQSEIFSIDSLKIENGKVTVGTVPSMTAPRIYSALDLTVTHFSFSNAFPFKLSADVPGNGTIKMGGNAGPLNAQDTTLTPFEATLGIQHLDPVKAGFLDQQAGVSGVLNGAAKLSSNGTGVDSSGQITGTGMKFSAQGAPAPVPMKLTYRISYTLSSSSGNIASANLTAGQVVAGLTGTFHLLPAHSQVNLQLAGDNLSIDALQSLLPAFGVKLPNGSVLKGGTLSTTMAINGPLNDLVITGPVAMSNTQLSGFNLKSKLSTISALNSLGGGSGNLTQIQTLRGDVKDTPQAITITNILAVIPALGQATGSGTILPGGQLNFNMLAKLSGKSGLGAIANGVMSALPGIFSHQVQTRGIPLTVRGTTSNPTFNVDASVFTSGTATQPGAASPNAPLNSLGKAVQGLFGSH